MQRPFRRLWSSPKRSRIVVVVPGRPGAGENVVVAKMSRFNPVELALFLRALPLARRAQRVRAVPIHIVVEDLCHRGGGLTAFPVDRLARAADRASDRWHAWFGGLNTCLVRSLVLGSLLAGRGEVVLNLGFRPGDQAEPDLAGHAWVTVGGQPVGGDGQLAETRYTRVLEIPYCAPRKAS